MPRRICPRFWALERPAAACVFRGLQNAHQGSSAQGFGPLRGLQQHAFSGACKTHIREALPKPGKTGGNMSRNLFAVRHERSELRGSNADITAAQLNPSNLGCRLEGPKTLQGQPYSCP